jgi:hypothetical protein
MPIYDANESLPFTTDILFNRIEGPFPKCDLAEDEREHRRSLEWALSVGVIQKGTNCYKRIEKSKFYWLSKALWPNATREHYEIGTDFIVWGFAFDDEFAEREENEELQEKVKDQLSAVLAGNPCPADASGYVKGLADICRRLYENGSDSFWLKRFQEDLQKYLESNIWIQKHKKEERAYTWDEYLRIRYYNIAALPCIDLWSYFSHVNTDSPFFQCELFEESLQISTRHFMMVNDILSLQAELSNKHALNMIIVHYNESGTSLREACEYCIDLCNQEMKHFKELREKSAHYASDSVLEYLEACEIGLQGHLEWFRITRRY